MRTLPGKKNRFPFPPVWRKGPGNGRPPLVFLLVALLVILPWSLYASNLYGGFILVDTTSAYNLLLGARTAYNETRSSTITRNFAEALLKEDLTPHQRRELLAPACLLQQDDARIEHVLAQPVTALTQAERQQLMLAEARCLLQRAPQHFAIKSLQELVAFFQINYTGAERMSNGFALGRLPRAYSIALFLLEDTLYVLLLPLAIIGLLRSRNRAVNLLIGGWWLYLIVTAPLMFAINRFRLPLLPFLALYAPLALLCYQPITIHRWRRRGGYAVTLLLALLALTPYAYLQQPPASWASYLGPYPSSVVSTRIAWETRPIGVRTAYLVEALGQGDATTAQALLAQGDVLQRADKLAPPLIAALRDDPAAGLRMLPDSRTIAAAGDWRAAVVRGDLLRRLGDTAGAKAAFTPEYVDDQNPVEWAWEWLAPPPTRRIDLAGNLDLGYIHGFYLGEGDPAAQGTFRWSAPQAQLLFPQQGSQHAQQFCMRADGRGWPTDMPPPQVRLFVRTPHTPLQAMSSIILPRTVEVFCVPLPPTPTGEDVLITLRSDAFVPAAADLLGQQGPQTGQLRLLGVRLDWAELRGSDE